MKRPPEIKINQFQLAILLNDEEKQVYKFILAEGVFCGQCLGVPQKGIGITEIFLNDLNDLLVRGNCRQCNSKVARVIEFGEDKEFYQKAMKFRKSISI